ncbi:Structural maintenance of chromosomes protein 2 [Ceratobasidium sp. 394]|nr:Structural maintenance of chromosomes protein 2 [Ceratobasidium sp. 394]KAG9090262.1 Structural maintenance of chromosomes protein 2 [Ceratobasidium sp. UAMH 11750]
MRGSVLSSSKTANYASASHSSPSRISPPRASAEAIARAKRLAPGKVFLALELVQYLAEARAALQFVFGDTLICEDNETAKTVTFDPNVRMRSVTRTGSVYDPSGTLSGGSAPASGGILKRVQEVEAAEDWEREARRVVEQLRAEEEGARGRIEMWDWLTRELELKNHQPGVLEAQVGGSDSARVNSKVMHMIEGVEKKDKELQEHIAMVQKDKLKIESTIQELDREKLVALEKTFTKVNEQFSQIFAELLPSNFAKLQPPEGKELTEGLEVKVRLGQVWKQSLTELSGGQRSLIVLSLIMALLQFKPARMYILDEIDAALDLSHTQHINIGTLFRNRFQGSHFVVVSLKEGLFTNANVLFRTRFRDNTSIIERTAQRSTSAIYNGQAESSATGRGQNGRARGQSRAVTGEA